MKCKHYNKVLTEEHRHYINSLNHDNCVLCLVNEHGPFTQEEISKYFGVSKMRISQLQRRAEQKLEVFLDKNKVNEWLYDA